MSDLVQRLRGIYGHEPTLIDLEAANRIEALEAALEFYGNPETYHAILFMSDPPCGGFMEDFSEADDWTDHPYNRPMPGARARRALEGKT